MLNYKWKYISILLLILFVIFVVYHKQTQKIIIKETHEELKKVPVAVQYAQKKEFQDIIKIMGNVNAKHFVHVSPKQDGVIENIFVDEGDFVIKDKTELFQTEKFKYEKSYEIRKQDLELAKCGLNVSEANLERVKADYNKAEIDYNRFKRLFDKKAVTKNQIELQESRFLQASAALKQSEALLKLSKEQEKQALATFEMAKRELTDTLIKAPISGVVTKKLSEAGENRKTGETVLRIDDLKTVEISAFVPGEFYLKIVPGKTEINIFNNDEKIKTGFLSYKSPIINERLRNFEIKFECENSENTFVPGMLLDLKLVFEKKISVGVPFKSILQKKTGKILYTAENGVSKLKKVKTGLRTNGWIEIIDQSIKENECIITEGQFILKPGLPVQIKEGAN